MASLADLQRAPGAPAPATPPGLNLDVDNVRTFDTPEFAGMTFLEVAAKTALNKVTGHALPLIRSILIEDVPIRAHTASPVRRIPI